jgi:protein gp37
MLSEYVVRAAAGRMCRSCKQWGGVRKSHEGQTLDERTYDELPTIRQDPR